MKRIHSIILLTAMILSRCGAEVVVKPENLNVVESAYSGDVVGGIRLHMSRFGQSYSLDMDFGVLDVLTGVKVCNFGPNFEDGEAFANPDHEWVFTYEDGSICATLQKKQKGTN